VSCPFCADCDPSIAVIKSEIHFLIDCPFYSCLRLELFYTASNCPDNFIFMTSVDKFYFLIQHDQLQFLLAKILNSMMKHILLLDYFYNFN